MNVRWKLGGMWSVRQISYLPLRIFNSYLSLIQNKIFFGTIRRISNLTKPAKSWYICKAEDETVARQAFKANDLDIQSSRGKRYLGGFIGSNASKVDWLGGMVTTWVAAVEMLALVARNYPQAVYAGFTFSLQNEWQ